MSYSKRRRRGPYQDPYTIPSQSPVDLVPYDTNYQPDVAQFPEVQKPHPLGWGPYNSHVTHTFDSRPVNTVDFLKGNEILDSIISDQVRSWSFVVPQGRTLIFRKWDARLVLFPQGEGETLVNADGSSNVDVIIDILINGSAVDNYNGIEINTFPFGPVRGDTFVLIPETQTLTYRLTVNDSTISIVDQQAILYGNLMLADGRSIVYQVGNQYPLPVTFQQREGYQAPERDIK